MIILATLLSFGWPKEKTVWVPHGTPCPAGMFVVKVALCCGSMIPALHGGETAYAETPSGNLEGYIASDGIKLHRVVADNGRAVIMSGDANRHSDGWEPKGNIRYVLRYVVRPSS